MVASVGILIDFNFQKLGSLALFIGQNWHSIGKVQEYFVKLENKWMVCCIFKVWSLWNHCYNGSCPWHFVLNRESSFKFKTVSKWVQYIRTFTLWSVLNSASHCRGTQVPSRGRESSYAMQCSKKQMCSVFNSNVCILWYSQ